MLGFYCINKPSGMGSTQVVSAVKRFTGAKCGHLGTLDPMASGVLPVAVGKATKLFDWFLTKDKKYFAIGLFGTLTDTLDAEGKITQKQEVNITKQQIDKVLDNFKGKISQIPPLYSAVSVNGKKAYELARDGQNIDLPTRNVSIYDLQCKTQISKNLFAFTVHCSAGTYIRTLINDIAKSVGTVATTVCIIRTDSGAFNIQNSNTIQELQDGKASLIEVSQVINLPKINFNTTMANKLLNGQTLKIDYANGDYLCYTNNSIMGIAKVNNTKIKLDINLWENSND